MIDNDYLETKEALSKITPQCKWEDIKVGDIYHIPPILSFSRKDVVIVSKGDYTISYREINPKATSIGSRMPEILYKAAIYLPFMVKHKMRKIEMDAN